MLPPAADFITDDQRANNRALLRFLTPSWERASLAGLHVLVTRPYI